MKFSIANLGRIQDATLDIKPLTVFLGKNGTHKTWALNCLHALLETRAHRLHSFGVSTLRPQLDRIASEYIELAGAFGNEVSIERTVGALLDGVATPVRISLPDFGDDNSQLAVTLLGTRVRGASASIDVEEGEIDVSRVVRTTFSANAISIGFADELAWTLYTKASKDAARADTARAAWIAQALESCVLAGVGTLGILPAERLSIPTREPGHRGRSAFATALYAQKCYGDLIHEGIFPGFSNHPRHANALGATYETNDADHTLVAVDGVTVPFASAASFQKSNLGIAAFLELADPGAFLLIDEPEMNAHPASQVKLAELFAWMIRQGYRLVLATHSPYLVDHLCTLLEFGSLGEKRAAAAELAKARKIEAPPVDAYLLPEEVAAYEFGTDGVVRDVFNRKTHRIDWATFTKVSENEGMLFDTLLDVEFGGDRDE